MKPIYAILLLFISCTFAWAEGPDDDKKNNTDAMLFGDVKSGEEHIPFATVTIKGTTIGTAADATGHFKMAHLPLGKQVVVISAIGYQTIEKQVQMEAKKSVTILAELEPDNIGIEQVVVSADRNAKSRKETPTIVNSINPKLFDRVQSVTLSEGLNFSPGLRMENNCQNCGFSQVRMNGLEGPYSQILINSRPVFSGLAGVYGLELIPANMIERVEVIRGGGSSMYGSNAIAGTINLITKDPVTNSFETSTNNSFVGAGSNYDAASDYNININGSFVTDDYKTGMSIFGFHRKRDPFDANGDGFSELASINNTTIGARFYQRVASRGKITVDYFNINEDRRGGNKFELPLHESDISESVEHQINSGAVNFDLLLRESDKFSAFVSMQGVDRDSYYGAEQDPSAYGHTEDLTYAAGLQYIRNIDYLLFSPATLTSGIETNGSSLKDEKLGYYDAADDIHYGNTQIADQGMTTYGAFLQSEWKTEKVVFSAGLRYDHYNIEEKIENSDDVSGNVLSPRVSLLYNIAEHLQFRSSFGRGFRAPQIFDEDLHIETSGSRKVLHENDPDLKQESSNSFTTSLDYSNHFGDWQYQLLVEGFYTQLIDPFANEYGTPDENGTVVYTRVNAEDGARVQGINMEFNASPSQKFQLQSGFTVQKSEFEAPQEFGEKRFFRTPNTYGYLSANISPTPVFDIALTGNYTGKMLVPYFGPEIANPETGELRESDSFFDTGVKLCYHFRLSDQMKVELSGGVKNIFNSYQEDFDYGIDRDPSYVYGPLSPRTIYFGIKIGTL
ncbi:TonB-dependent receptor [Draconibacterium halophilum]|uniref:TonB-dependent receptor n=1 Tax=Draconibacterium halophilum TaxID=2706887 RepID=A0A6C0RCC7_9BACT|nr:TonB-dependent receptor [Draconibacterium halophilum]QIA06771.1 TonB-dependent receptor [Draconibacterium halophilum]